MVYPTLWLTFVPIDETLGVLLGVALTALFATLMLAKSPRIAVTEESLVVGRATLERKFINSVTVVSAEEGFSERGRNLDPGAWIHFQGSVKTMLKVNVNDPEDPTPYWLFSTRRPVEIAEVLGF